MSQVDFSRTNRGIANYGLFLNADLVFYCEGEENIFDSEENVEFFALDYVFWVNLLEIKFPGRRLRVIPVGPKSEVKKYVDAAQSAEDAEGIEPSVFGCVDRDYDEFTGILGDFQNGRYYLTEGYSVENDLFSSTSIERLVDLTFPRMGKRERNNLYSKLLDLDRFLKRVIVLDVMFRKAGIEFITTDGVPPFIEMLRSAADIQPAILNARLLELKQRKFEDLGISSWKEYRQKFGLESFRLCCSVPNGFEHIPGKTLVKSVGVLLHKIGRNVPSWGGMNPARFQEILVSEFLVNGGISRCNALRSTRPLSWAHL